MDREHRWQQLRRHGPVSRSMMQSSPMRSMLIRQHWGGVEYARCTGCIFWLEPLKPSGDKKTLSGVFYAEPSGTSVHVSKQNGLLESSVALLITEIKKNVRDP
jgi:hypothetical protein